MDLFREDMVALRSAVQPLRNIADELRIALDAPNQFTIRYQPIIDGKSKEVELAKALLRWTSPVLGEVLPGRFIQIAEQNGLIRRITNMVLRKVCEDLSTHRELVVSVNVSRVDITDPQFPKEIAKILAEYNVSPARIILECTESISAEEINMVATTLRKLRQQGHAVAIYEMDTGFTSFGFLKTPGYTLLKIDKVLLDEALQNATSRENLQGAINASKEKGFKSLAFGVETAEQAELVEEMGFDLQQGYFHSPSLSLNELIDFSGHCAERLACTDG